MSDPIVTVNPDDLAERPAASDDLFALVCSPAGPIQRLAFDKMLAKLIATSLCKATSALLTADLAHDGDSVALVFNDPTALLNGWWRKTGASGAGAWEQFEILAKATRDACLLAVEQAQDANASAAAQVVLAANWASQTQDDVAYIDATVLTPTALQPQPVSMAYFGQDSADNVSLRHLTPPAGAFSTPDAGQDWYIAIHARTGNLLSTGTQYEMLFSGLGTSITGGGARYLCLNERGVATGAGPWRFEVVCKGPASTADLFAGLSPALSAQPIVEFGDWLLVYGIKGGIPHFATHQIGGSQQSFRSAGASAYAFSSFLFPAAEYTNGTVECASGVITYRRAGTTSTYIAGVKVLITSTDRPNINGVYTIATRLAGNAGFTVLTSSIAERPLTTL